MTDFIQEAAKEVRIERIQSLIKKFAPYLAVFILFIGLAFFIHHWYSSARANSIHREGADFLISFYKQNNLQNPSDVLESLIAEGNSTYATISRLVRADEYLDASEMQKMKELLDRIVTESNKEYSDFAKLVLYIYFNDDAGLNSSGDSIYAHSFIEMQGLRALDDKKYEQAIKFFNRIIYSTNASNILRERAIELKNFALYHKNLNFTS